MAADLHQAQLLLPPPASAPLFPTHGNDMLLSTFGSSLSLPSDKEEEYPAELTRRMAHLMLQEEDDQLYFQSHCDYKEFVGKKSWCSADSPQSTLSPATLAPSSSAARGHVRGGPCDLTDRFSKMNLASKKPASGPYNSSHLNRLGPAVSEDEIGAVHFNQTEHLARQTGSGYRKPQAKNERRSSPWPPLQQQQQQPINHHGGSGMRAVFLGGSGLGRGSCGTGVFLPRGSGNSTESRRKPRCSTVLIPARVAQALMLHFDKMQGGAQAGGVVPPQHVAGGSIGAYCQQKRHPPAAPALDYNDTGLHLPQEWMY